MGCATGWIASREAHTIAVSLPRPATLSAELSRPSGPGPFPAVVILHGCNGVGPNMYEWARWLRGEGYAALVLGGHRRQRTPGNASPCVRGLLSAVWRWPRRISRLDEHIDLTSVVLIEG
jgi:dienelactone hydrolase